MKLFEPYSDPKRSSRIMIRYRARAFKRVKARSWKEDLKCRFCNSLVFEYQEHLEECAELSWERGCLKMDTGVGEITFSKRAKRKLEGKPWCPMPRDG